MRRWAAEAMPPGASLLPVTCNTRGSYLLQLLSMLQHPHTRGRVAGYPHFLEHVWQPLLTAAGLPYRKYHSTRHSFATWLLEGQPSRSPPHARSEFSSRDSKISRSRRPEGGSPRPGYPIGNTTRPATRSPRGCCRLALTSGGRRTNSAMRRSRKRPTPTATPSRTATRPRSTAWISTSRHDAGSERRRRANAMTCISQRPKSLPKKPPLPRAQVQSVNTDPPSKLVTILWKSSTAALRFERCGQ